MELKQGLHRHSNASQKRLLIEPVWNWNRIFDENVRLHSKELLIEPVWNWNYANPNRSSSVGKLLIEPVWNWNPNPRLLTHRGKDLLIEPVWNWNDCDKVIESACDTLLIEPVWNWNVTIYKTSLQPLALLIEPVWNWNKCPGCWSPGSFFAFNRTSMELKLRGNPPYRWMWVFF